MICCYWTVPFETIHVWSCQLRAVTSPEGWAEFFYQNRLQNGWLTALVPRRNVMEGIFWIVSSARSNVIHSKKYLKASVLLPSELDGWSLKRRQFTGLWNSQFCAYFLSVSRVAKFTGSLQLNCTKFPLSLCTCLVNNSYAFNPVTTGEKLAWVLSSAMPMLSWKFNSSEISYATTSYWYSGNL